MEKRYNYVKLNESRFTFAQFKKMVWQMSAKDDYHFIDFQTHFEKELKALYYKTGKPLLKPQKKFDNGIDAAKFYLQRFDEGHKNCEASTFYTFEELIALIKECERIEIQSALNELGFEYSYYREPYSKMSKIGVWLKEKNLPF